MYDAIIVGGGHNGLTCAAYLAGAGLKTLVLERRPVTGGAAVTEEFHPGFRNSTASYTVSLLNPKVITDLELHAHGLRIISRDIANFWPLGTNEGAWLKLTFDPDRNQEEFARHSREDASALPRFCADIEAAADVLRAFVLKTPPDLGGGLADLGRALDAAIRVVRAGPRTQALLHRLLTQSAATFLKGYFSHPAILGALAFDGVVGAYASPWDAGTAYVLLHHAFGEVNGKKGQWGHAIGGMGAISDAIRAAAEARGAEVRTNAPVARILTEDDAAVGVRLASGEEIRGRMIAANVNPKLLGLELLADDAPQAAQEFRARMNSYACGSGTFRMNVALDALPDFACLPGKDTMEHHRAGIIIGPDLAYLDDAYLDARRLGWSRQPIVEMLVPSTMDETLAPPGAHVASLFCQHFAPQLPSGLTWEQARDDSAAAIINAVTRFAPNFRDSIIATQLHAPADLEEKFGLTGGDIFHGRLSLDQMYSARPILGAASYRLPLKGLFLCGAGAHPGGGVTGAPGHNAAREMLREVGRRMP